MSASGATPGFVNKNGQVVLYKTEQRNGVQPKMAYKLGCSKCGQVYATRDPDVFERKCPACQGGEPGMSF